MLLPRFKTFLFCLCVIAPVLPAQNPRQPGQLPGQFVPLTNKEKFDYRVPKTVALRGILGAAIGSGFLQLNGSPKEWGGGVEGYAKRYGSTFGGAVVRQAFNFGFETVLNEDPRYFPLDGPSTKARIWNALRQTLLTRTDSGKTTFAYGRVAGAFAAGQFTRLWQPDSQRSFGDGLETGGISIGVDAAVNLLYEFVPRSRPKEIYKH